MGEPVTVLHICNVFVYLIMIFVVAQCPVTEWLSGHKQTACNSDFSMIPALNSSSSLALQHLYTANVPAMAIMPSSSILGSNIGVRCSCGSVVVFELSCETLAVIPA